MKLPTLKTMLNRLHIKDLSRCWREGNPDYGKLWGLFLNASPCEGDTPKHLLIVAKKDPFSGQIIGMGQHLLCEKCTKEYLKSTGKPERKEKVEGKMIYYYPMKNVAIYNL